MNLVISKCLTAVKVSNFSGHYLLNRSTLDIGVLGCIGIVKHKEHSPEVLYIPPGTPCIHSVGLLWTRDRQRPVQICVVQRRGYVLRNASLGDFVVVRTSYSVLTQT